MANSRPAYWSSAWVSLAATPRSIARPITNGITAWLLIQTMPKNMPSSRVRHWPLAIHHRKRTADRWSAVPGWSRGSGRTRPRYGGGGCDFDRIMGALDELAW